MPPTPSNNYDVIVIGAGHAGCEAALASARLGTNTAMITMESNKIAVMSCNPAIGGIAKSHLVFEVDSLGGEIGRNTDCAGIQFRILNTRRGPAVQANRVQCDKEKYRARMHHIVHNTNNLTIIDAQAIELLIENGNLTGVRTEAGTTIKSKSVVITAGTFLGGRIHIGDESISSGRFGEGSSDKLSKSIQSLGFKTARLKTGTPPRLHKDSLNYDLMSCQPGLEPAPFFSHQTRKDQELFHVEQNGENSTSNMFHVEQSNPDLLPWVPGSNQIPCYLTHTTKQTHAIIADNLSRSSWSSGNIEATGVRYCPSIEDKIVKFPDKDSHHVFIEPEGRETVLSYPNGISNSLPRDVQADLVHSIPGLEKAEIIDWAYAIEYDFFDPTQLYHTLQTKLVENLYFAGQINGTTGYEEAAAQGFVAGVNAALKTQGRGEFVLSRCDSYIGVLVDDLVTKGTDEPYRMFTSRAEHRLILRQDNARFRMLPFAQELGIVTDDFLTETKRFVTEIEQERARLDKEFVGQNSLTQLLRRPEIGYDNLESRNDQLHPEVIRQVEIVTKYDGYIQRELLQIEKAKQMEDEVIPDWIDYWKLDALRYESKEKFSNIRPENLGQAARIPGISPADITILSVIIKRGDPSSESSD